MTRKFDVNDKYPLQTALKIADKEFFPNLHAMGTIYNGSRASLWVGFASHS